MSPVIRTEALADLAWPELTGTAALVLVIPIGSTEQHGPHLPFSTDTDIACAVAGRLAAARPDIVVAPALPYGASGEHAAFAGTLSIGHEALKQVLIELGRSADAFGGVVFVSAHGGNAEAVRQAEERLTYEGRNVRTWSPASGDGDDLHAGRTETSVLLALTPGRVRTDRAAPGATGSLRELWPLMRTGGTKAVSANGVLGDPTGADANRGRALLDRWTADLVESLTDWPGPSRNLSLDQA